MHLLCIDFANLVVRHAANPYNNAVDEANRPVGGAVGALSQTLRLTREMAPTHLVIGKDGARSECFRREIHPGYKADRKSPDDDLRHNFEVAYRGVEILGLPTIARPRFEADDIIASAARAFPGRVTVVTGDKDLLAVCSSRVTVRLLRPGGYRDCGPDDCADLFGVAPKLVRDYKALVGDASDGIKGVHGVGHKTALQLIGTYGSLERILQAIRDGRRLEGITPAMERRMRAGVTEAEISYQLAGLVDDLELPELASCTCPPLPRDHDIGEQLSSAGLHDLRQRLDGSGSTAINEKPLDMASAFAAALKQDP